MNQSITLVFDCGSTKATVAIIAQPEQITHPSGGCKPPLHNNEVVYLDLRHGHNAVTAAEGELAALISCEPRLIEISPTTRDIFFYGAGCAGDEVCARVSLELKRHFHEAEIHVHSDMLGAARALCGCEPGIVGILGTGSNSCLYDGAELTANVSPLGYILGDEGSGAVLGKLFLERILKGQFSRGLTDDFNGQFRLTPADVVRRVYREPRPNAFLASFAPYIASQCDRDEVREFVINEFRRYIRYNLTGYEGFGTLPVHFVGSIASHFAPLLREAMSLEGGIMGTVCRAPIEGLAAFHQESRET